MAYVNKEQSKKVKEQLQAKFPKSEGWEFSVSIEHHSTLNVAIMRAPVQLIESKEDYEVSKQYENFNVYHLNNYVNAEILNQIKEIANAGNFDNSDLMTDYHHVGFYLSISAGEFSQTVKVSAHKIEGIAPNASNNFYGTGSWQDYVAVQLKVGERYVGAIEVIEKSRLTDERARAKRETGGNGGLVIWTNFQAFETETAPAEPATEN